MWSISHVQKVPAASVGVLSLKMACEWTLDEHELPDKARDQQE